MADDVATVQRTLQRLRAAGTARIMITTEMSFTLPESPERPDQSRARRFVGRAALGAVKTIGKTLCQLVTRRRDPGRMTAEGVIDFTGRRFMIDYGGYARIVADDHAWSGPPGREKSMLDDGRGGVGTPLWMVDLLAGTVSAQDRGAESIDDHHCRHYAVIANLAEASAGQPHGMPTPKRDRFEDLLALPIDIWLDGDELRRTRFAVDDYDTTTVTFADFGVDLSDLDWSRLPRFRTPAK